tara:strand:+ start:439 stop:747 length:309 start_codon:yes stop_codon:yes gene_type:complete
MSKSQLIHRIKVLGQEHVQAKQVAKRLDTLLPVRFEKIKDTYRENYRPGKSHRLSLVDKNYIFHVKEYCQLSSQAFEKKILCEIHMSLFLMRQSINKYNRPF